MGSHLNIIHLPRAGALEGQNVKFMDATPLLPRLPQESQETHKAGTAPRWRTHNGSPFCVFFRFLRRSHSAPSAAPRESLPGPAPADQNLSCRKKLKKPTKPAPHQGIDPQRFPIFASSFDFCGNPTPRPPRLRVSHSPALPQQARTSFAARITRNPQSRQRTKLANPQRIPLLRLLSIFAAIPLRALRGSA